MLDQLTIHRFKSVRDQSLTFGKVNLFIGGNGAGKSNLLEAIGLTSACLGRGLGDSDIGQKGLRITPPEIMKSSFKNEDLPATLELKATFKGGICYNAVLQSREGDPLLRFFSESSSVKAHKIFGRSNRGASSSGVSYVNRLEPHRGMWDQIKIAAEFPVQVREEFDEFSKFVIYAPQTDFLRGRQSGRIDTPPIGLHGEGLSEAVASLLDEWKVLKQRHAAKSGGEEDIEFSIIDSCLDMVWMPGWANQFGVHHASAILMSRDLADRSSKTVYFRDRFMHSKRNRLSVYDSSEGTLFLLFAAIILTHKDAPKIFAFDNIDSALNPKLTKRLVEQVIRICKTKRGDDSLVGAKQIFLTSHNPTALDAFDLFDEELKVFVVRRNQKGHTVVSPVEPPKGMSREDWMVMANGRKLSQIWLDGDIPGALGEL